jgi:hypothetical protein
MVISDFNNPMGIVIKMNNLANQIVQARYQYSAPCNGLANYAQILVYGILKYFTHRML